MARSGRELAIAHGSQLMPEGLLADRQLELVPQPLGQVDDPPAHDTVSGRNRPRLDDLLQRAAVPVIEDRLRPRRLACRKPFRPIRVETHHPVPHDLPRHAANESRITSAATAQDRCNRQQTAHLRPILAAPGMRPNITSTQIIPKLDRNRHRKPPQVCDVESAQGNLRKPQQVRFHRSWYKTVPRTVF